MKIALTPTQAGGQTMAEQPLLEREQLHEYVQYLNQQLIQLEEQIRQHKAQHSAAQPNLVAPSLPH